MALSCPHILQENGGGILADDTGFFLATESGCVTVPDAPFIGWSPPKAGLHGHYPIHRRFAWKWDYRNKS